MCVFQTLKSSISAFLMYLINILLPLQILFFYNLLHFLDLYSPCLSAHQPSESKRLSCFTFVTFNKMPPTAAFFLLLSFQVAKGTISSVTLWVSLPYLLPTSSLLMVLSHITIGDTTPVTVPFLPSRDPDCPSSEVAIRSSSKMVHHIKYPCCDFLYFGETKHRLNDHTAE